MAMHCFESIEHSVNIIPYRWILSRWLVGTVDLGTVEIRHSSRVSKFWVLKKKSNILNKKFQTLRIAFVNNETIGIITK